MRTVIVLAFHPDATPYQKMNFHPKVRSACSENRTGRVGWDTAGQERFKCIAASYYRGANVVIVVFDLSDESTLTNAEKWMIDACENASEPCKFLVGTKKDLLSPNSYEVVEQRAAQIANSLGAEYWALSSKTGENVQDFFFRAVSLTFEAAVLREYDIGDESVKKQKIGDSLNIKVEKTNLYETKGKKPVLKCCN
ncbi:hypothetical protein KUTeg_009875 [Tegillarca granosa]|uniref:Ras-related protein Rab-34 n=1 Tax=Tegillarca granosa TaxID=220873 RepID=A0ABQ9F550_TEGGR|nr:hypothetical protein KUTeg_009875 [Tegillarca granosa]